MKPSKYTFATASLIFVMAAATGAQMGMRQTQLPRGVFHPVVGQGALYEQADSSGPKRNVEFDIVGKDSVNGKDAYWLEFTMTGTEMGDIISKIQMVVDAGVTFTAKTIVQMGGSPPMEMPAAMTTKTQTPTEMKDKADDLGSESVTTPAGTFSCEHYRMKDGTGDAWISDKVSPFGLVKSVDKDGSTFDPAQNDQRRDRQNYRNACAVQSDVAHGPRRPLKLKQSPREGAMPGYNRGLLFEVGGRHFRDPRIVIGVITHFNLKQADTALDRRNAIVG